MAQSMAFGGGGIIALILISALSGCGSNPAAEDAEREKVEEIESAYKIIRIGYMRDDLITKIGAPDFVESCSSSCNEWTKVGSDMDIIIAAFSGYHTRCQELLYYKAKPNLYIFGFNNVGEAQFRCKRESNKLFDYKAEIEKQKFERVFRVYSPGPTQ